MIILKALGIPPPPFHHLKGIDILNFSHLLFDGIFPQIITIMIIKFKRLGIVIWDLYAMFILIDLELGRRGKYVGHSNEFLRIF